MHPRAWRFLGITLAAVLGVVLTAGLGAWQLDRAHQKRDLQAAIDERSAMPALDARALIDGPVDTLVHRAVIVRGTWLARHTVFLDNRQMQGRPGFYVVTPLQLEGEQAVVLVQRGWAPRDFQVRERLPAVDTPGGTVEVRGRVAPGFARLYEPGGAGSGTIRQNLALAAYREETGLPLLDVTVVQTGAPSEGLLRLWPRVTSGSERNYGYALQWWALSALITILYVWFQFIAPYRKRHGRGGRAAGPDGALPPVAPGGRRDR